MPIKDAVIDLDGFFNTCFCAKIRDLWAFKLFISMVAGFGNVDDGIFLVFAGLFFASLLFNLCFLCDGYVN